MARRAAAAVQVVVAVSMLATMGCRPILSVSDAVRIEGVPTLLSAYAEHQSLPGLWHPARGVKVEFLVDGATGLLPLIRHERDDRKFRAHAIVLPANAAIRAFLAANAAVLEDPARLQHALRCRQMLLQQTFPYQPRR